MAESKENITNEHRKTFPAYEKLKRKKQIEKLFRQGKSITEFPVQAIYYLDPESEETGTKVAFSVPKKFFKLAVNRNRIKRLMRESYRLNKHNLAESVRNNQSSLCIMFVYKSKEIVKYNDIEQKIFIILQRLQNILK